MKYKTLSEDSIFNELQIRSDVNEAFLNAIKRGMENPYDWMYMYSKNNKDYFKNCITREYVSYLQ